MWNDKGIALKAHATKAQIEYHKCNQVRQSHIIMFYDYYYSIIFTIIGNNVELGHFSPGGINEVPRDEFALSDH